VLNIAKKTKFLQRKGGKIDCYDLLLTLVFRTASSLPIGLGLLTTFLNCLVSRTALHKKFNERSVLFFKKCLFLVMSKRLTESMAPDISVFNKFNEVMIIDSSRWDIPDHMSWLFAGYGGSASKANCKIQLCYDYKTGEAKIIQATRGTIADQKYGRALPIIASKGMLFIFDLGYWVFDILKDIRDKKAFFLSRYRTQVELWIFDKNDKPVRLNFIEWLNSQQKNAVELQAYIQKYNEYLPVRVIAWKMPEEIANRRRMDLKYKAQKKGRTPKSHSLAFCSWSVFATNADDSLISGEMIRTCYRIRWNIELIFKAWKSVLNIHKTNVKTNTNRFRCELYAKLILTVIIHRLYKYIHLLMWKAEKRELSIDKFWKYMDSNKQKLHEMYKHGISNFINYINQTLTHIIMSCEKNHQKSRYTSLQMIDNMLGDLLPIKVKVYVYNEEIMTLG